MKRMWTLVLMVAMVLSVCTPVYAADEYVISAGEVGSTTIEYLDNGDYIETVITMEPSEEGLAAYATTRQVKGKKTANYRNADGDKLWSVTVTATFQYVPGSSVSCIEATASAESYSSTWKVGTATASYSGNTATGTVTATKYWLFVPGDKVTLSVTLKCDVNGNLS